MIGLARRLGKGVEGLVHQLQQTQLLKEGSGLERPCSGGRRLHFWISKLIALPLGQGVIVVHTMYNKGAGLIRTRTALTLYNVQRNTIMPPLYDRPDRGRWGETASSWAQRGIMRHAPTGFDFRGRGVSSQKTRLTTIKYCD